jgi:predicted phage tail protein
MSDGLVKVRLWGTLGDQFGHEHEFAIRTPLQAISALEANYPTFRKEFVKHSRYYFVADEGLRDAQSIHFPVSKEVDIAPHVEGEAFVAVPVIAALSVYVGTTAATIITYAVITALMIGVSLLLTPKPKKATNKKDNKDLESNVFAGPDNLVGQGGAIPLIYGRCFVGSVVISVGIETSDQVIQNTVGKV